MKGRPFLHRLGFALAGLREIWRGEASFRTQCRIAIGAGVFLVAARPGSLWAALVVLATGIVLALEAANAAIEALADTLHPAHAPGIGRAKDVAAAAVLIASLAATGVGVLAAYSALS